jgi:hypothetical protein
MIVKYCNLSGGIRLRVDRWWYSSTWRETAQIGVVTVTVLSDWDNVRISDDYYATGHGRAPTQGIVSFLFLLSWPGGSSVCAAFDRNDSSHDEP